MPRRTIETIGPTGFERVSDFAGENVAYMVEIERYEAKVGGAEALAPIAVRADGEP